ncbi:MAG TPA: hypothetical protein VFE47_28350 [Tepidisphaeraceae bacterium]|jgi:hypothetical protein|nr:hypothetical protein [Tepidisphaeraceae bacterium]
MLWLLDSDVIWKLAQFELFAEALVVLDAEKKDLRCLPELGFQLRRDSIYKKHTIEVVERVRQFIKGIKVINNADPDEQVILQNAEATYQNRVERIDGGEQTLFIATKVLTVSIIVTHDKKALRTLANDSSCTGIYERVKGRVLCFEQLVIMMIDQIGYKKIQSKIGPRCEYDDAMRVCFANGKPDFAESDCKTWLNDYINKLVSAAPGLVRSDPAGP